MVVDRGTFLLKMEPRCALSLGIFAFNRCSSVVLLFLYFVVVKLYFLPMFLVITQCLGDGEDQDKEDLTNMQLQKRLCRVSSGMIQPCRYHLHHPPMMFLTGRATRLLWIIWKLMKD